MQVINCLLPRSAHTPQKLVILKGDLQEEDKELHCENSLIQNSFRIYLLFQVFMKLLQQLTKYLQ